jgi:hypothetical protein
VASGQKSDDRSNPPLRQVVITILALIFTIIGVLIVFIFILLYGLTSLGRWVGGRIDYESKITSTLDYLIGIDRMQEFRDNLVEIVESQLDNPNEVEKGNMQLRTEPEKLRQRTKNDLRRGDFVIAVVSGSSSLLLSTVTPLPFLALLLSFYGILMTFLLTVRVIVTDVLVYSENEFADYSNRKPKLVPMYMWNKGFLTSYQAQAGTIVIGILMRFSPTGYDLALKLIEDAIDEDMDWFEFSSFVAGAVVRTLRS